MRAPARTSHAPTRTCPYQKTVRRQVRDRNLCRTANGACHRPRDPRPGGGMADTKALEAFAERCAGSSPVPGSLRAPRCCAAKTALRRLGQEGRATITADSLLSARLWRNRRFSREWCSPCDARCVHRWVNLSLSKAPKPCRLVDRLAAAHSTVVHAAQARAGPNTRFFSKLNAPTSQIKP